MSVDDWLAAARAHDPDDVRECILAGFKSGKPFTPYVPTLSLPASIDCVLDFGCGLGRNFPYLTTVARSVVGFDLPPMIERCREISPVSAHPRVTLTSDWVDVCARRFDLVFTTLVLQHVESALCRKYLEDFARLSPAVYVLTRVRSDFDSNVLELIEDCGVFDLGDCVEVDHDFSTHQLRVLDRKPFVQARRGAADAHYEVLLRSVGEDR
jgi:SAM-dependent methyltransferase